MQFGLFLHFSNHKLYGNAALRNDIVLQEKKSLSWKIDLSLSLSLVFFMSQLPRFENVLETPTEARDTILHTWGKSVSLCIAGHNWAVCSIGDRSG